jgi:hypothetical protein
MMSSSLPFLFFSPFTSAFLSPIKLSKQPGKVAPKKTLLSHCGHEPKQNLLSKGIGEKYSGQEKSNTITAHHRRTRGSVLPRGRTLSLIRSQGSHWIPE